MQVHGTSPWPDVEVGGAEGPQPGRLRLFVVTGVRQQVEMDAVRHGLHVVVRRNPRYGPPPLAERNTA